LQQLGSVLETLLHPVIECRFFVTTVVGVRPAGHVPSDCGVIGDNLLVAGNEFVARVAREGPDQVIASADHAASELVIHEDRLQAFLAKSRPVDRRRRLGQAASEVTAESQPGPPVFWARAAQLHSPRRPRDSDAFDRHRKNTSVKGEIGK
jgi:hypothetical protein